MVAHIAFPHIDKSGRPATFSRVLLTNLLRDKYRYEGLIITDDLAMAGADFIPDIGKRTIAAIEAGCDIIIMTGKYTTKVKAYKALYQATRDGRIPLSRIHESLYRILKEKNRLGLLEKKPKRLSKKSVSNLMRQYRKGMNQLTSSIAITNMKNSFKTYPGLKGSLKLSKKLRIFTASYSTYQNIKKKIKMKSVFHKIGSSKHYSINKIIQKNPNDIGIFHVSGVNTARILNKSTNLTKSKLIVINTTYPGLIPHQQKFKSVLNINTTHPRVGEWVVRHLINSQTHKPSAQANGSGY